MGLSRAISLTALLAACAPPVVQVPALPAPVPQKTFVYAGKATMMQWERGVRAVDINCDGKPDAIGSTSENEIIAYTAGTGYLVLGKRADDNETLIPAFRFLREPDGLKVISMTDYGKYIMYTSSYPYFCSYNGRVSSASR